MSYTYPEDEANKNEVGRPLKFKSPKELEKKGMDYIKECRRKKKPITVTGLCLHLDTSRETLMNYQQRDEFFDTIKRLKLYAENYAEEKLFSGRNTVGAIFALKNYGWRDSYEIDRKHEPSGLSEEARKEIRERLKNISEKQAPEDRYNPYNA